jgi:hypothetical protein
MGDVADCTRLALAARRQDSPWYPAMRLFRQKKAGDWLNVTRELAGALAQIALWPKAPQPGTSVVPIQPSA